MLHVCWVNKWFSIPDCFKVTSASGSIVHDRTARSLYIRWVTYNLDARVSKNCSWRWWSHTMFLTRPIKQLLLSFLQRLKRKDSGWTWCRAHSGLAYYSMEALVIEAARMRKLTLAPIPLLFPRPRTALPDCHSHMVVWIDHVHTGPAPQKCKCSEEKCPHESTPHTARGKNQLPGSIFFTLFLNYF